MSPRRSQVAFGVLFLRGEAGATGEATSQTLLEELGKHEARSVSPPSSPTQQPQLQFQSRQERCRFLLFIIFMWKKDFQHIHFPEVPAQPVWCDRCE